jgi:hypothetical protein
MFYAPQPIKLNPTIPATHAAHPNNLPILPSTYVEGPLQIRPFMQNKPNFLDALMNVSTIITKDYDNKIAYRPRKNRPNQTQFESQGRTEKWNVFHGSSDLYYRTMRKSPDQIYDELLVPRCGPRDFEEAVYKTLTDTDKLGTAKADFKKGNRSSV